MWGGGIALAYAVQLAATLAAMAAVVLLTFRHGARRSLRNALVCAATC